MITRILGFRDTTNLLIESLIRSIRAPIVFNSWLLTRFGQDKRDSIPIYIKRCDTI